MIIFLYSHQISLLKMKYLFLRNEKILFVKKKN